MCQLGRGVHIPNLKKVAPAISEIGAAKVWGYFFVFFSSFRTLSKICHKTRIRAPIGLKFGTLRGHLRTDFGTLNVIMTLGGRGGRGGGGEGGQPVTL